MQATLLIVPKHLTSEADTDPLFHLFQVFVVQRDCREDLVGQRLDGVVEGRGGAFGSLPQKCGAQPDVPLRFRRACGLGLALDGEQRLLELQA